MGLSSMMVLAFVWVGSTHAAQLYEQYTASHRHRRQLLSVGLYEFYT